MSRVSKEQIYREKNTYLSEWGSEVTPLDFYHEIFDEPIERRGHPEDRLPNPIVTLLHYNESTDKSFMLNHIVFQDFKEIEESKGRAFALCSLCTYGGKRKTAVNAYKLYGFAIDLDGVGAYQLESLRMMADRDLIPYPTYVVNSGNGVHVYYKFLEPIPLYPPVRKALQKLKHGLTLCIWTKETSTYKPKFRQFQGIYQGFRMPGSCSKLGRTEESKGKYLVKAFKVGKPVDLVELSHYVDDEYKMPDEFDIYGSGLWEEEHLSLDKAKELYPEWYQKRVIEKQPKGTFATNPAVYRWWLKKIPSIARDGNRYWCIAFLFCYGIKCRIDKDIVFADAYDMLQMLDDLTVREDNPFTEDDILKASKYYEPSYAYMSIKAIETKCGIHIERSRRNGRKQAVHMKRITRLRDDDYPNGTWRNENGAPTKQEQVLLWRKEHPNGKKIECQRETGLSRPTVLKWWDS